jgi:hypothetical protein
MRQAGNPDWYELIGLTSFRTGTNFLVLYFRWKSFEAVLSCVGSVADELLESGEDEISDVLQHIDLTNLLTNVVPQLLVIAGE